MVYLIYGKEERVWVQLTKVACGEERIKVTSQTPRNYQNSLQINQHYFTGFQMHFFLSNTIIDIFQVTVQGYNVPTAWVMQKELDNNNNSQVDSL